MVTIVCHDAGGAELICAWAINQNEPYNLVLEGPAIKIFERNLGKIKLTSLEDAIIKSNWVLCGTSWQSNLEREAIKIAKNKNKLVISFLDHWVNYLERFTFNSEVVLPNEIWVGDSFAEKIAKKVFPDCKIELKENYYFNELKAKFDQVNRLSKYKEKNIFLYICEPIQEHALFQHGNENYWGYTEFEALKFFLDNTNIFLEIIDEIWIRPHPSENPEKYNWVIGYNDLNIRITGNISLFEEIAQASVIIGCESMAMVVGLLAEKRVVTSIPSNGRPCSLPFSEIEYLHCLIDNKLRI